MNRDFLKWAAVLGLILVGLVLAGCGESRSQFAGTYRSVEKYADKYFDLDLKENGKGSWSQAGRTMAEFTWVVNDGKVWMYLRNGGILIGTPGEAGKTLSLDMTGDWHPGCPPNACVVFTRVSEGG